MSFEATVYRILIGAPSDIEKEIEIARTEIYKWNDLNSCHSEIFLLPLHWSINTYPTFGSSPQDSINEQLVSNSDLMICIFGTRIGTVTNNAESGTIEEIEEHIKRGKEVMVFFKRKVSLNDIDEIQLNRLREFKNRNISNMFFCEYEDENEFKRIISDKLNLFINTKWKNGEIKKIDDIKEDLKKEIASLKTENKILEQKYNDLEDALIIK